MSSRFVKEFNRLVKSIDKKFSGQASIRDYDADNMNCFIVELAPNNGPYKHGKFLFQVHASDHYPDSAPDVVCLTDIYHPNIDADLTLEHNICLNLFDEWNRTFGIEDCLQGLLFLLYHPNVSDPVSSYFESGLDQVTFLRNVGRSLRGEEVDGFTFQKNHGWAEHEVLSVDGAAATSNSNEENSEPAAASALVAVDSLAPNSKMEAAVAYSTAPTSTEKILTATLSECKMATKSEGTAGETLLQALTSKEIDNAAASSNKDTLTSSAAETSKENHNAAASSDKDNSTATLNAYDNTAASSNRDNLTAAAAATSQANDNAASKASSSDTFPDSTSSNGYYVSSSNHVEMTEASNSNCAVAKSTDDRPVLQPVEEENDMAESSRDAKTDENIDFPRLLLDGTSMPAIGQQQEDQQADAEAAAAALVDSGRPDSPDSLSLASDCSLQDLLTQLQFGEALDGDNPASIDTDLPRDFVCRRFRAAPDTSSDEDDDDDEISDDSNSGMYENEDDDFVEEDYEAEEFGAGELVASVEAGVHLPLGLPRPIPRYRPRSDPAAAAATAAAAVAAASRRSLTVVARSSAPVLVRLRGGGLRSVQLLQVEASSRYPGMLSISLNGRRLQPSLARLFLRQAARTFADSGYVWLGGGAAPMTLGGGADSACLLVCVLARHCLLPCLL